MQRAVGKHQSNFADDVLAGLTAKPKYLSSKYFYDDEGSRLFQEIMRLPEYYLTRSEYEIFNDQTQEIFESIGAASAEFDLIELGAGDGSKTSRLVEYFLKENAVFSFDPIDISAEALNLLAEKFRDRFPGLEIRAELGDYSEGLERIKADSKRKKVILFLGSNIGNFSEEKAIGFFRNIRSFMSDQDFLFTGFDLHKNPTTIVRAYDDSLGVTAKFNLNLLKRINRELGGNFETEEFTHYASYHPMECAARSFLISRKDQIVRIESLGRDFEFSRWEPIFMEVSQKYNLEMIENLAEKTGFQIVRNFYDENRFYTNSLWKIRP